MSGTQRTSAELDTRRRRILFRAWHRGIREMDLVLGQYADKNLHMMDEAVLDEFEGILAEDDNDLFKWVSGEKPLPERLRTDLFEKIRAYVPDEALRVDRGQ